MSVRVARRMADQDLEEVTDKQMIADQAEAAEDESAPIEVLVAIQESDRYFAFGLEGVPHDVVMQRLRAARTRK